MINPNLPRLISRAEMSALTGFHVKTLERLVHSGDLPAPIRISRKRVAWSETTYRDWIDSRPKAA